MKTRFTSLAFVLFFAFTAFAQEDAQMAEKAVQKVIQHSYLQGIHIERDSVAVREGFHPDFSMAVLTSKGLKRISLDSWLDRMKLDGTKNTAEIEGEFTSVEVSGNAATVRLEVYKDSKHIYTDFFGLYRFPDGWKIVSKHFHSH
ncbi:MAG: hypothetical protein HKN79_03570 [Flavobacteriales bacterium]|nr:hypothetical protein [Flavobacteriales bacterium]